MPRYKPATRNGLLVAIATTMSGAPMLGLGVYLALARREA